MVVRFDIFDVGGPWCLSRAAADLLALLFEKIRHLSKMTMNEVFHQGSGNKRLGKDYPLDKAGFPCDAANRRFRELQYDDEDSISRIEIQGLPRLYGFRRSNEFFALWYDTKHEIWPSSKR